jgi:uncharacterized Ntn-hydrolase superfamily protein
MTNTKPFDVDSARFAATYSIVARDPVTGQLGVAGQSHYFAVGSSVSWAEAGVGAVATQAFGDPAYGVRGLDRLRDGTGASEVLQSLVAEDDGREIRQVAIVDSGGGVAVHTGRACVAEAGHYTGDGFSVQGNMLRTEGVVGAMAEAFEIARGDLDARMLAALVAAEHAGGDVRGRQSAAMLVVGAQRSDRPWDHIEIDLRVDDHPDPLLELRRLLGIARANQLLDRGLAQFQSGHPVDALALLTQAREANPTDPQTCFWTGVVLIHLDRLDDAQQMLRVAYAADPGWRELLRRLAALGLVPNDVELIERLADEK